MLFSAGTFLYVATVHVLPELMSMNAQCENGSDQGRSDKMQRTDLFLMVFGIVSPLLLSQTHSHHWRSNSFPLKTMALFFFLFQSLESQSVVISMGDSCMEQHCHNSGVCAYFVIFPRGNFRKVNKLVFGTSRRYMYMAHV